MLQAILKKADQDRLAAIFGNAIDRYWRTGEPPIFANVHNLYEQDILSQSFADYLYSDDAFSRLRELVQERNIPPSIPIGEKVPERFSLVSKLIMSASLLGAEVSRDKLALRWKHIRLQHAYRMNYHFTFIMATGGPLTQVQANFLTLQGIKSQGDHFGFAGFIHDKQKFQELVSESYESWLEDSFESGRTSIPNYMALDQATRDLAQAFVRQLIEEVKTDGRPPIIGDFVLATPPLDIFKDYDIEQIRLCLEPTGMWISVINNLEKANYAWGWWSPEEDNLLIDFGNRASWMMRILCASIWRDACIVRTKAFKTRSCGGKHAVRAHGGKVNPLILPRTIYTGQWADPEEVARIDRIQREAHAVRAHYRRSETCTAKAKERAAEYAFPLPPQGYTFVSPYMTRGAEEIDQTPLKPVICRGLLTASIALARFAQD